MVTLTDRLPRVEACADRYRELGDQLMKEGFTPFEVYLAARTETMLHREAMTQMKILTPTEITAADATWDAIFDEQMRWAGRR